MGIPVHRKGSPDTRVAQQTGLLAPAHQAIVDPEAVPPLKMELPIKVRAPPNDPSRRTTRQMSAQAMLVALARKGMHHPPRRLLPRVSDLQTSTAMQGAR